MSKNRDRGIIECIIKWIGRVNHVTLLLSASAILITMVAVTAEVLALRFADKPIEGVTELSELLMVVIVFLGAGFTQVRGRHVKLEIVTQHLTGKVRELVDIMALLVMVSIVGLMTWRTSVMAFKAIELGEYKQGAIAFPLWPSKMAVCVGLFLLFVYMFMDLLKRTLLLRREEKGGV